MEWLAAGHGPDNILIWIEMLVILITMMGFWLREIPFTNVAKEYAPKYLIKIPSEYRSTSKQVSLPRRSNSCVILYPTNASIAETILDLLPGEIRTYFSIDEQIQLPDEEDGFYVPLDLLNKIELLELL